jgi:DnaJ-class molecular chaperone
MLRLPHKGLPVFGSKERGDMYLRVRVHIPERLSAEERTLYERLRTRNEKNLAPDVLCPLKDRHVVLDFAVR